MKNIAFSFAVWMLAFQSSASPIDHWVLVRGGAWLPGDDVIAEITASIQAYVQRRARESGMEMRPWSTYTFQFQGQVDSGKKVVFINALCTKEDVAQLQTDIMFYFDGGSCFFHLRYDPNSRKFSNLIVNGNA